MFSVVLVSYNSGHILANAIRSVPAGNQIIVADNASTDDSVEITRNLGAEVFELERNFGFGTACNRGAAMARHEKLLFLNPDAVLDPDALTQLAIAFDKYPDAVAFNPRIVDDGKRDFRWRNAFLPRPYLFRPKEFPQRDQEILVASGAALAMRKSEFDKLGGFDENIFLYYEDDDLSARIVKSNRKIRYIHQAVVHHRPWRSSAPSPELADFREYNAMRSRIYASRKHGRPLVLPTRIANEFLRMKIAAWSGDTIRAARARSRLRALRESLVDS